MLEILPEASPLPLEAFAILLEAARVPLAAPTALKLVETLGHWQGLPSRLCEHAYHH